jgi:predicted ATP-binding protein involved in virulence
MRLHSLTLQNIGVFKDAQIDFITENDNTKKPPITIITGENGTGKTTVLDAIRLIFGSAYSNPNHYSTSKMSHKVVIGREIARSNINSSISMSLKLDNHQKLLFKDDILNYKGDHARNNPILDEFRRLPTSLSSGSTKSSLCLDYWTSKLATDFFDIQNFTIPKHNEYLVSSLSGLHKNKDITNLICYFDYLRSSESPKEKVAGEFLYATLKRIFKISLNNAELAYVQRSTFTPIVKQGETEITLDKLSSGNMYLIQRLVSMLSKMYSIHVLNETPIETMLETEGLLLIDEAENHLHPKWQKTFLHNILDIFPNLQIILTTHSPFIVASHPNTRLYVCESKGDYAIIKDETAEYSNKPIDEILISPLFSTTYPFNQEITELLQKRKIAIQNGNKDEENQIESTLKELNPQYFGYLDIDMMLAELAK